MEFISITGEDGAKVKDFLQKHPIAGWVILDRDRKAQDAYSIRRFPATFLVDATGILRAITKPEQVTRSVMDDLLAGLLSS